ncbi:hypothetical protein CJF31_00011692 [Rutstroemia sp. NJR-2017a BVV2]|nr:hypothetical protein CJF31_00011692 [Rutstroemia sp. NJR-2017a BVV2]
MVLRDSCDSKTLVERSSTISSSSHIQCNDPPAAYGITFYIYDKPLPPLPKEAFEQVQKPLPPLPLIMPQSANQSRKSSNRRTAIYFDEKEVYVPYSDEKEVFLPYFDEKEKLS